MSIAILFALMCLVGWGTGDIFSAKSSRKAGVFHTTFWINTIPILLATIYLPFAWHRIYDLSGPVLFLTVALSVLLIGCYILFNTALKIGNPTVVGTICGSFIALVVVFSTMFLHETLSTIQIWAVSVIFCGLLLTNLNIAALKTRTVGLERAVVLSIIILFGWGVYFTFIKIPITHAGWFITEYISGFVSTVVLLITAAIKRERIRLPKLVSADTNILWAVLLSGGAMFWINIAYEHGKTAVVAPIAGSYPVLFALASYYAFKEPLSRQQKIGMVVTLCGIVFLSVVS